MTVVAFGTYTQTAELTAFYPADATESTATVSAYATVGAAKPIAVQAKDAFGNNLIVGGDTVVVSVTGANTATPTVTDNGNGTYSASYTPTAAGTDSVAITLNGTAISGSPFTVTVGQPVTAVSGSAGIYIGIGIRL